MGRPDKRERQAARAEQSLRTALVRGRAADAAEALLSLPVAAREAALQQVAGAMEQDITRAAEGRDQSTLVAWLGRTEREPRLLSALGERALATRWQLFTAALRARAFRHVERLWPAIRPALATHELLGLLDAVVRARGEATAEANEAFAKLQADAARMGYDTRRPRASTHRAPTREEDVEDACLRCFGGEPFSRFRELTSGWLRDAAPEVSAKLRVLCAELSERELLLRSQAGDRSALEVARYIAGLVSDAAAPPALEPLVALSVRVAARALAAEGVASKHLDALCAIATNAARYEALRPLVAACVLGAPLTLATGATRAELLRLAVAADGRPATLVAAAIEAHVAGSGQPVTPSTARAWLSEAIEAALAAPAELARALQLPAVGPRQQRARDNECAEPCHALLEVLPIDLAVRVLDRVWDHADEPVRVALAGAAESVIERMRTAVGPQRAQIDVADFREALMELQPEVALASNRELRALMRTSIGRELLDEIERGLVPGSVPEAMRPLFETLAARAAAYSAGVLDQAIARAESKARAAALGRAYVARVSTLVGRLRAMQQAVLGGHDKAAALIEDLLADDIAPSVEDAAHTLQLVERAGAPLRVRSAISRLLLQAAERDPAAAVRPGVARALGIARRRVEPRKAKAKRPRAKRSSRTDETFSLSHPPEERASRARR